MLSAKCPVIKATYVTNIICNKFFIFLSEKYLKITETECLLKNQLLLVDKSVRLPAMTMEGSNSQKNFLYQNVPNKILSKDKAFLGIC